MRARSLGGEDDRILGSPAWFARVHISGGISTEIPPQKMTGQSDIEKLREAVLPIPEGVPESWLNEDCLKRFLRADGGDLEKATARLRGTLQWRGSVKPERIACTRCASDPFAHYMQQVSTGSAKKEPDLGNKGDGLSEIERQPNVDSAERLYMQPY